MLTEIQYLLSIATADNNSEYIYLGLFIVAHTDTSVAESPKMQQ